jgi:hypothetical protein
MIQADSMFLNALRKLIDGGCTARILSRTGLALPPTDMTRLQSAYRDVLQPRFGTPRVVKRFFGQLYAGLSTVHGEVNFVDFLLVTWLRTVEPRLYSALPRYRGELTSSDLKSLLPRKHPEEDLPKWREILRIHGVSETDTEDVLDVMALLFLPIRSMRQRMTYGGSWLDQIGQSRGVGHQDYFDRYFAFTVPSEEFGDAELISALEELASETSDRAGERIVSWFKQDNGRLTRGVLNMRANRGVPSARLIRLIASNFGDFSVVPGGLSDARSSARHLARQLLSDVLDQDLPSLVRGMSTSVGGTLLAGYLIAPRGNEDGGEVERPGEGLIAARTQLAEAVEGWLSASSLISLKDLDEDTFDLIWVWRRIDTSATRAWLDQRLASSAWDLLDFLAKTVPTGVWSDGQGSHLALGDVNMRAVDELVGLDRVMTLLELQPNDSEGCSQDTPLDDLPPTWENRRYAILERLRRERDKSRSAEPEPDSNEQVAQPGAEDGGQTRD